MDDRSTKKRETGDTYEKTLRPGSEKDSFRSWRANFWIQMTTARPESASNDCTQNVVNIGINRVSLADDHDTS